MPKRSVVRRSMLRICSEVRIFIGVPSFRPPLRRLEIRRRVDVAAHREDGDVALRGADLFDGRREDARRSPRDVLEGVVIEGRAAAADEVVAAVARSEEHTSELQSRQYL